MKILVYLRCVSTKLEGNLCGSTSVSIIEARTLEYMLYSLLSICIIFLIMLHFVLGNQELWWQLDPFV